MDDPSLSVDQLPAFIGEESLENMKIIVEITRFDVHLSLDLQCDDLKSVRSEEESVDPDDLSVLTLLLDDESQQTGTDSQRISSAHLSCWR